MANDWIKICHGLADKPEVVRMSFLLKIDRDFVAGKLLRLWFWLDQNTTDGNGITVTRDFIDDHCRKKGFAAALVDVKWLSGEDNLLIIPNFQRHNGETAKARAESNRRVANHRERTTKTNHVAIPGNAKHVTNVTQTIEQKPLPEKRREDKEQRPYFVDTVIQKNTPGEISKALRSHGAKTQPSDPRIIAMSQQGVSVETIDAACEEAKRTLVLGSTLSLGYVAAILKRWSEEAHQLTVSGATRPGSRPPMTAADFEGL